jgi:hypothetical protein
VLTADDTRAADSEPTSLEHAVTKAKRVDAASVEVAKTKGEPRRNDDESKGMSRSFPTAGSMRRARRCRRHLDP